MSAANRAFERMFAVGKWESEVVKGIVDSIHAAKEAAALRILAQHKGR